MLLSLKLRVNLPIMRRVNQTPSGSKLRLDLLLVDRGLVATRAKAQALVLAGEVFSDEQRLDKPGLLLPKDIPLRVNAPPRFVSRGGEKLEGALVALTLDVSGLVCVDVGASTGGFSDCLLQRGAAKIFAVDVGEAQLAARVANDPRVVVRDRTNARHLEAADFGEPIDLAVVDASFIGIDKLLPALGRVLSPGARLLALIKPQFEAGRREATRHKGVIRDPALRSGLIAKAVSSVVEAGFELIASVDSTLAGPKGNVEHFVFARRIAIDGSEAGVAAR
jgi:23S rRNA (cytidine1920-2'-O)/16S rRNA (cytidine1409-2'-O)-methyltransferase